MAPPGIEGEIMATKASVIDWLLEAVHPDAEGGYGDWMRAHPKQAPTPFALERSGQPSAMITLTALSVLRRLDEAA
jgi:hypothetical protein